MSSDNVNVPKTLLLADDSVTIQRVIELTFADEDIRVVAVSDGDQAIARLETTTPDIVLADVGMPGRSGYEVAQYIKQTPRLAHIPVLLLTGAFEPVDHDRAAQAGCDGVLAKPFEPQLVISRVKELLARSPAAAVEETAEPTPVARPVAAPAAVPAPTIPAAASAMPAAPKAEDYFDRLDAAFANLSMRPALEVAPPPDEAEDFSLDSFAQEFEAVGTDPEAAPEPEVELEVVPEPVLASAPEIPVAAESSAPQEAEEEDAPAALLEELPSDDGLAEELPAVEIPQVAALQEPLDATPYETLPLAEAFAAILAAEQSAVAPASWPGDPLPPPAEVKAEVTIDTDEIVQRVAHLVIERLSDQVVRETVADVVSQVAERLVQEEIDRIKTTIK